MTSWPQCTGNSKICPPYVMIVHRYFATTKSACAVCCILSIFFEFVAQFKRGQILEMSFKILWFWPINPFTSPIFDPSPQKNFEVIYGPPLGLILTYMNVLCIWMYIRALSELKFKLSNQDGWFIKSQKVSIENGYEENTRFKFLPHLKLKSETSILLLL